MRRARILIACGSSPDEAVPDRCTVSNVGRAGLGVGGMAVSMPSLGTSQMPTPARQAYT